MTNETRRDQLDDLAKRMSTSAQQYAATGDTRRYEATHEDINAVLDMRDQETK
ncbi:hypothetical protein OHR86_28075 [Streptomyces sp. NBC_00441]|uniref:hypothetical protein n=1 Tax=Streptomyces sp. NBC_00441 TaxID=2975742 RepID=UPI002E2C55C1|nr:hypothetical protein [Streptomyces sp. NBC_00441]